MAEARPAQVVSPSETLLLGEQIDIITMGHNETWFVNFCWKVKHIILHKATESRNPLHIERASPKKTQTGGQVAIFIVVSNGNWFWKIHQKGSVKLSYLATDPTAHKRKCFFYNIKLLFAAITSTISVTSLILRHRDHGMELRLRSASKQAECIH